MKNLIALLIIVQFLQGCSPKADTARYQLKIGVYDQYIYYTMNGNSTLTPQHGVFKIDTQTGRTWIYIDTGTLGTNEAATTEGWREIKDVATTFDPPHQQTPAEPH